MRTLLLIATATLAAAITGAGAAAEKADAYAGARKEFQQAYDRASGADSATADSESLKK
jgi:hypothetical protein